MLISAFTLFGQNLAIDWANSHPKVSILSANSYANLSDESKALLGESVLIYQHQFSQQDINAYLQLKESSKLQPITKNTSDENQQVKDWLAPALTVFPNPSQGDFRVQANQTILNVNIIGLDGVTKWRQTEVDSKQLSVAQQELIAGMYILEVETKRGKIQEKITIR